MVSKTIFFHPSTMCHIVNCLVLSVSILVTYSREDSTSVDPLFYLYFIILYFYLNFLSEENTEKIKILKGVRDLLQAPPKMSPSIVARL